MAVKAVTPRVIAISGHVAFYRDADFFDAAQDERATGEDIFDPEWPDKPLRLKPTRGSHVRPADARRGHTPMYESADHGVSLDGRSALSPSFSGQLGGGPAERNPVDAGGGPPSSPPPAPGTLDEQSPGGCHRPGS